MEIEQHIWGFTEAGEAVVLYTMRGARGVVTITNAGASVVGISVPDRNGTPGNVALGYADWQSYLADPATMGKTVGRYANRIAGGRFTLDGKEFRLPLNDGRNHLHGGPGGFGNRLWASRVETDRVVFSLVSPDGDQGYPAEAGVEVVYDWSDDNLLEITFFARSDGDTVINLTNHTYFNMAGGGTIDNHLLRLNASHYLPTDAALIPTGELAPVEGIPMDFRMAKVFGSDAYDSCWAVDDWHKGAMREVASLGDPVSGRAVVVSSTQPGVQVYTGECLANAPAGPDGGYFEARAGVAIECQGFPDAPNRESFPSQTLRAGELYNEKIAYRFTLI